MLFHVWLWCKMSGIQTTWWISLFDKGALGVDIFMLLSAYGLQSSLEINPVGRFYMNRLRRLYPVYILFLLTLFFTFERSCPFDWIVTQWLCQLTGLSLFKYPDFFSCGFCFDWFTPAIILLYISFPVISRIAKWIGRKESYYDFFVILLLVGIGVWIRENKHFPFGLLAIRMPIIFIGILMCMYLKQQKYCRVIKICIMAASLGLLSGNEEMRLSLLILPFLIAFSFARFKLPFKSFLCFVGRHSFEIYLAHIIPVGFIIPLRYTDNTILLIIMTIMVTGVLASLFSIVQKKFWNVINIFSSK